MIAFGIFSKSIASGKVSFTRWYILEKRHGKQFCSRKNLFGSSQSTENLQCVLQSLKINSKTAAQLFGLPRRLLKTLLNWQSTVLHGTSHNEWKHLSETIKFLAPILVLVLFVFYNFVCKYQDDFCLAILGSFILQYQFNAGYILANIRNIFSCL